MKRTAQLSLRVSTVAITVMWVGHAWAVPTVSAITVETSQVILDGRDASWQILVNGTTADGRTLDVTHKAAFRSNEPGVAHVQETGVVEAMTDGHTTVEVVVDDQRVVVSVEVTSASERRSLNFENDIVPILSKFGCNSSGCHGKAEGQNGFKLSVFGFDPTADFQALAMEGRGRRVFPAAASRSLLLQKVSGAMPHGGGVRIEADRPEYRILHDWIASGLPLGDKSDPRVSSIEMTPRERTMAIGTNQQLRVVATFTDGRRTDVTRLVDFQSNNDALVAVDDAGFLTVGTSPGSAAVMATYLGNVDVFRIAIPRDEKIEDYPEVAEHNFIDRLVHHRLRQLNIVPAKPASDADFLRRVYLDLIGTLPTTDEAREFLSNSRSDRREQLVTHLLERREYADYWALKWSDLLRVNRRELGHKGAYEYYHWIRDSFGANKPIDQFAKEVIAAEGPLNESPAGHFYKAVKQPNQMASTVSQVFLGVRIECAQCHHHPWDRWSQSDYFGMQAYFTQFNLKQSPRGEAILSSANRKTTHPRTGGEIFAHALGTTSPDASPDGNRRHLLADWITSPDNPWFARNIANRLWAHLMGRGLVEPVDDFRLTNPPTNPELLDALAEYLVDSDYDMHQLIRLITSSQTYQRSTNVNDSNHDDQQNYSRFVFKQLEAEVLLDAVCQTTGIGEKFRGVPEGSRAIQLWDSEVPHYFLKLFGRPVRVTACECERVGEPTVSQVLHVLNSPKIHKKLSHEGGRIAKLVQVYADDKDLIEELYLAFVNRFPTDQETEVTIGYLADQPDRRQAAEDIAWSMMNSLEFLFNH